MFPNRVARERLMLWCILLIAAWLRTHLVLQIEHNVDHAYPVWQALLTLERGQFPLLGQNTSLLFPNPPLTGYLFLPLVALVRLPLAPYLLTIPLNVLGVLLAYRALRVLIGRQGALIGAFLMAVNPWVIEYSRTSWVQSLLPFLMCALTWALFPVLVGKAKHPARRTILAGGILAALANTYLLAYIVVLPVTALVVIFRRRFAWKSVLIGAAIVGAAGAVYFAAVIARGNSFAQLQTSVTQTAHISDEAWSHALRLITGKDYAAARGSQAPIQDGDLRQSLSEAAHMVITAVTLAGIGVGAVRVIRQRDSAALILLLWFLLPVALMTYVGLPVHPFYQLVTLPAGYGIFALGLLAVLKGIERINAPISLWAWRASVTALAAFGVLMSINSVRYYQETAVIPAAHGLTALPLSAGLEIGAELRAAARDGVVYSELDNPYILSSFAGMLIEHGQYSPHLYGAARAWRLRIGDDLRVVDYTLERLPDSLASANVTAVNVPSDIGISLIGYAADQSDNGLRVDTYWRVDARLEGVDGWTFGGFAHIFDVNGGRIAVLDDGVMPGSAWRVGDIHRYTFTLTEIDAAALPVSVAVGMYDPNRQVTAVFVMPDGEYTQLVTLD